MKQRIRVVGIVKTEDGVLVFKRNRGRAEAPVFWELPTGKIKFGEQPEEAMARSLEEYAGLSVVALSLKDVVTFLAPEGSTRLSNLYIVYDLNIGGETKPTPKDRYTAYKYVKEFTSSNIRLDEASMSVIEIEEGKTSSGRIASRDTANSVTINVDGASRGNPGPSGIGYCVYDNNGNILKQGGEFIGFATSRVAEYCAMRKGVELALELGYKKARFISDSLMVVNQLNGIFSIKNRDILPVYEDIQGNLEKFDAISFAHTKRENNIIADHEANLAINKTLGKG